MPKLGETHYNSQDFFKKLLEKSPSYGSKISPNQVIEAEFSEALKLLSSKDQVQELDTSTDIFQNQILELIPNLIKDFLTSFDRLVELTNKFRFRLRESHPKLGQDFTEKLRELMGPAMSFGRVTQNLISTDMNKTDKNHTAKGLKTMKERTESDQFKTGLRPDFKAIADKPCNYLTPKAFGFLRFFNVSDEDINSFSNYLNDSTSVAEASLEHLTQEISRSIEEGMENLKTAFEKLVNLRAKLEPGSEAELDLWQSLDSKLKPIATSLGARITRLVAKLEADPGEASKLQIPGLTLKDSRNRSRLQHP